MNRSTITIHTIDVDRFNRQRGLIAKMVSDLNRGESAFVVKSDTPELSGILAILDEINGQNDIDGVDKRANESPCTGMGTTLEYVNVVFLRDQDGGDIFAVFPCIQESIDTIKCYSHQGEHSKVTLTYCAACVEVTDPVKYSDLANELDRIGYKLRVVSKDNIKKGV